MRLAEMAGQTRAVSQLLRAVARGRVPHAYLFDGPPGVGKRSAAIGLGMAMACPTAQGEGCGNCDVCRRILAGNHPDVRVIAPASAFILVEQANEVVTLAAARPHEAAARVIVLDDADRLNASAANCLLKTLEEPFAGNHLILVTSAPERLLSTIRSRTQRVRFLPVPAPTLVDLALRRQIDRPRAETAAALAGGSVAQLWKRLDDAADQPLWHAVTDLRHAAGRKDIGSLFEAAASFGDKESKETLPEVIRLCARFYRDALAIASDAPDLVLLREKEPELRRLAEATANGNLRLLRQALAATLETETALAANVNAVTALEKMLMALRPCEQMAVS